MKKMFLKILQYSRENTCVGVSEGLQLYLKKTLQHECFPVNIAKFLRTAIFENIFERLLLYFSHYFAMF